MSLLKNELFLPFRLEHNSGLGKEKRDEPQERM